MPSFNIHLAVAVKFSEKNNIENKEDFYMGSIAPDLVKDKSISHYTGMRDKNHLRQYVFEKVRLNEFLKENKVETDYEKGVFLHLATDFIFYQEFLSDEYLEDIGYDEMIQDLYYSYRISNPYLEEKYNIHSLNLDDVMNNNIKQTLTRMHVDNTKGNNLLPEDKMDRFINKMAKLNIENYIQKIKKENKNVFPDNYEF
ncbi:MAG: zinc dependent phospholipase C family protein [Clostridia bacterium]|nr:zinc dependent phospholipase C family protein [Clostridia bacterium]